MKICTISVPTLALPNCNVVILPRAFDISICSILFFYFVEEKWRPNRGKAGERKRDGGNICAKGQSRRVADVNLLHRDEAKSRAGGRPEKALGDIVGNIGQGTRVGRGVASLIILSYYLSSFINTDLTLGMLTFVMRGVAGRAGEQR